MRKKIAIIGIVGLPAKYGGFEVFVEQLVQRLWDRFDFTVYCQSSAFENHIPYTGKVRLRYLPFNANGIQSILYDMIAIIDSLRYADTLLILGVGGCPILFFLHLFKCRKNVIVNLDGIEWKRNKWSRLACWYLHFAEWCAVKYANKIVGDNKVICDYIEDKYSRKSELIEYGADNKELNK